MTAILQDKKAIMHVFAGLMVNPALLGNTREYKLSIQDFPERFHKLIFGSIYNLYMEGIEKITPVSIDGYLVDMPVQYDTFNAGGGLDYLYKLEEIGEPKNFKLYYNQVKKYSFLRSCIEKGIDVSNYYDSKIVDVKEAEQLQHNFNITNLEDMVKHFENKMIELKDEFLFDAVNKGGHMADNIRGIVAQKFEKPTIGAGLISGYFTAAIRGALFKKMILVSAASGVGKSRFALANMLKICVPEQWDSKKKEWIKTGATGRCLYVGTELDEEEVKIPAICYIADVDEDKIQNATLNEEEKARLMRAIDILEETPFWYEELHDFDLNDIEHVLTKNINKHGVQYVA